ncbi:hypothetical protein DNTS_032001, partial [Danionella cerebrum]
QKINRSMVMNEKHRLKDQMQHKLQDTQLPDPSDSKPRSSAEVWRHLHRTVISNMLRSGVRRSGENLSENGSVAHSQYQHTLLFAFLVGTYEDLLRRQDMERLKVELIARVQAQLSEAVERAITESISAVSTPSHTDEKNSSRDRHTPDQRKVFVARCSLLDELFEISHIRTIFHMFIAALLLFGISTLAVDYIDRGRSRFAQDWWNSTSFANYYRTWNIVVHDWLYYYGYRDLLRLCGARFRSVATLSVFAVSALVHEYAFTMGFGFFYPVMFCTFAGIGAVFNFALNDRRKSPVWNVIMWTCLFSGQGLHVCLYCLEWYAQIHCPRSGSGFWELVTPRSWICSYD